MNMIVTTKSVFSPIMNMNDACSQVSETSQQARSPTPYSFNHKDNAITWAPMQVYANSFSNLNCIWCHFVSIHLDIDFKMGGADPWTPLDQRLVAQNDEAVISPRYRRVLFMFSSACGRIDVLYWNYLRNSNMKSYKKKSSRFLIKSHFRWLPPKWRISESVVTLFYICFWHCA